MHIVIPWFQVFGSQFWCNPSFCICRVKGKHIAAIYATFIFPDNLVSMYMIFSLNLAICTLV